MNIECETPLQEIYPGGLDMELVLRQGDDTLRQEGMVTVMFRSFDGRIGIQLECGPTGHLPGVTLIPIEMIEGYRVTEDEWDIEREGDRAAFEELYEDEIESLLSGEYPTGYGDVVTWDELVNQERLSRLSQAYPGWHNNNEMVIYLTLAASTTGETPSALATRVGGALWAAVRKSNPERVALAGDLLGLKVDDGRFIAAAAATDPHDVARVASSAMFVGLGGEAGTAETMRLLTLLQVHSQVPRFF